MFAVSIDVGRLLEQALGLAKGISNHRTNGSRPIGALFSVKRPFVSLISRTALSSDFTRSRLGGIDNPHDRFSGACRISSLKRSQRFAELRYQPSIQLSQMSFCDLEGVVRDRVDSENRCPISSYRFGKVFGSFRTLGTADTKTMPRCNAILPTSMDFARKEHGHASHR